MSLVFRPSVEKMKLKTFLYDVYSHKNNIVVY